MVLLLFLLLLLLLLLQLDSSHRFDGRGQAVLLLILLLALVVVHLNRDTATSCSNPGVTSAVVRLSREYKSDIYSFIVVLAVVATPTLSSVAAVVIVLLLSLQCHRIMRSNSSSHKPAYGNVLDPFGTDTYWPYRLYSKKLRFSIPPNIRTGGWQGKTRQDYFHLQKGRAFFPSILTLSLRLLPGWICIYPYIRTLLQNARRGIQWQRIIHFVRTWPPAK